MLTNEKMYEIMDRLGMLDDEDIKACSADEKPMSNAEYFSTYTSKDLVSTMNFVNELMLSNSAETIEKLLVAMIYEGAAECSK